MPLNIDPNAKPLESLDRTQREMINHVQKLFEERPIWTRRALHNHLPDNAAHFLLKYAISYCGYSFRSGPWRDAIVRFGLDPRTDPQYRIYQTLMFQLVSSAKDQKGKKTGYERNFKRSKDRRSHIFTGKLPFPHNGKLWQLCDVEDPILADILSTTNVRETCDLAYFGWYKGGTLARVKVIMRAKTDDLMQGITPTDEPFHKLVNFPDELNEENQHLAMLPSLGTTAQEMSLASEYRALSRGPTIRPADKRNLDPSGTLDLANESRILRKPTFGSKRRRPDAGGLNHEKEDRRVDFDDEPGDVETEEESDADDGAGAVSE